MRRRLAFLFVVLLSAVALLAGPATAQPTAIRVDGKIVKDYIAAMSGTAQMGRRTLTPGYEQMADWAAAKFKEWGLVPAGDNGTYFQAVPIGGARGSFAWAVGVPELRVNGREFLVRDNDFTLDTSSTAGAKANAEVVFVGYGISAPAKGLDEYANVNVSGKVVLVLKGSPKDAPPPSGRMGGDPPPPPDSTDWTSETTDGAKIKTAYDKGAAAIMLYDPNPSAAGGGFAFAGGPRGASPQPQAFSRPFLVISNADARVFRAVMWQNAQESLVEFNARIDRMRRDIAGKKAQSRATGVTAALEGYDETVMYGEAYKNNISRNVLAKIVGSDPKLKEQYVIIGGHFDHLGMTNGVVMNGADDNASGSAVTMEVARLLAAGKVKPKRTIVFGLWTGEEMGLIGSRHYVRNPCDGVAMDRVVTYFNMDMVGLGTRIGAPGAMNFPEIFDVIKRDQLPEVISVVDATTGGPGGSDHSGFIELGIQALALMTSGGVGHPDYHQSGDDVEKIDPEILGKTGQFVLQGALNLANESKLNLLIPNRLELYTGLMLPVADLTSLPAAGGAPAAGRRGGGATGWTVIGPTTPAQLLELARARVTGMRSLQSPSGRPIAIRMGAGPAGPPVAVGTRGLAIFGGNLELLLGMSSLLEFGRLDVTGDDGVWFSNGVTAKGREMIKAAEQASLTLHLVAPSAQLLDGVLDAATKPVVVSGLSSVDAALAAKLNAKNALLVVTLDPADVHGTVVRLGALKQALGDTDNLVLSMKALEPAGALAQELAVSAAKKSFYIKLLEAGWTKEQITAIATGNLARLSPAPRRPTN